MLLQVLKRTLSLYYDKILGYQQPALQQQVARYAGTSLPAHQVGSQPPARDGESRWCQSLMAAVPCDEHHRLSSDNGIPLSIARPSRSTRGSRHRPGAVSFESLSSQETGAPLSVRSPKVPKSLHSSDFSAAEMLHPGKEVAWSLLSAGPIIQFVG